MQITLPVAAYGRFAAYERFGRMLKRENMTVKAVRTTPHIYPEPPVPRIVEPLHHRKATTC